MLRRLAHGLMHAQACALTFDLGQYERAAALRALYSAVNLCYELLRTSALAVQ
jgi:hypothetical protein